MKKIKKKKTSIKNKEKKIINGEFEEFKRNKKNKGSMSKALKSQWEKI